MKIKVCFRPRKGRFEESMKEKRVFDTIGQLEQFLKRFIAGHPKIEYLTRDSRLPDGGETFIVTDATHPVGYMWFETREKNNA